MGPFTNSLRFRGHRRNVNHYTSYIIYCMCNCSYYNKKNQIFKRCHYTCSIVKYCFPFFPILRILRGTHRMDLFVEVTNLTKDNTIWAHYTLTGYYPASIRLSWQIPKENVCIDTSWCCFKMMHIDWDNMAVTGISGINIDMPTEAKVSIMIWHTLMMIILRLIW